MFNRETWQGAQAEAQQPPVVEEPQAAPQQDATGDAPVSPTEVHDEPGIPQQQGNVEDAAPQAAPQEEEQGLTDEVSGIELGEPDFTSNGGDAGWDSQSGEEWLGETPWGTPPRRRRLGLPIR